ncbi:MAG: flagellar biosynthesis protein FlgJ [Treponema sp.]|nr:flagellar biosynthesis protein FlgJ [Treponema sp.]
MNVGGVNSFLRNDGSAAMQTASIGGENSKFADLLESIRAESEKNSDSAEKTSTISSSQILQEGRLNGDMKTDFHGAFTSSADKNALPQGAARNQAGVHGTTKTIDKTSRLYEKSMELESFFVKQMLSSMRKTVSKSGLGGNDFAGQMYEDMIFDEYATAMTKNAGFGLADQIYLSLV